MVSLWEFFDELDLLEDLEGLDDLTFWFRLNLGILGLILVFLWELRG